MCENDFLKKKNDAEWCCCVCDFFLVLMISEKTFLFCLSEWEIGRAYFCPSAHETPAFGKRGGAAGACDRSAEGMADFRREKNGEVARNVALRRKKGPPGKGAAKGDAAGEGTGRGRHGRGMLLRAAQRCARGNVGARRRRPCGGCGNGTAMGWAATGQPRGDGDGAPCTKTRRAFSPPKSHGRRVSGQGRQRAAGKTRRASPVGRFSLRAPRKKGVSGQGGRLRGLAMARQ